MTGLFQDYPKLEYSGLLMAIMEDGFEYAPRGQKVKELLNVQLEVTPACLYDFGKVRPIEKTLGYWKHEWAWYMSGDRKADYIEKQAKMWSEIKTQDGMLNSNYGYLVFYREQEPSLNPFQWAEYSLSKDRDSRQAVVTYNGGQVNIPGNKDYLCTQYQHFMIRGASLVCFIGLRSSDAIFGLPNNMPWWSFVQQQLFRKLKPLYQELELGPIIVTIDSAHVYERHFELVEKMLAIEPEVSKINLKHEVPLGKDAEWYYKNFGEFIDIGKEEE